MKLRSYLPSLEWVSQYSAEDLPRDALAGALVAILLVPQAMAYALLADLPPKVGLYAAILPAVGYAVFGVSRYLSVGPVALVSLLVADTVAQAQDVDPQVAAVTVAALVAAMLIVLGVLRLGFLVNFISDPVLLGFTGGAAIAIAASQVSTLTAIDVERGGTVIEKVGALAAKAGTLNAATVAIGAAAFAVLAIADRYGDRALARFGLGEGTRVALVKTVPLVVVIAATAITAWARLDERAGVAVVGDADAGLPPVTLPSIDPSVLTVLLPGSLAIAIIVFVTAIAVAKSLAGRRRQKIDSSQEALALGASNLAGAFTGAYPVGASISRSALNFDVGARTPCASLVTAALVLATSVLFAPLFYYLPKAVLAALVINAVFGLFKVSEMLDVWRFSRLEGAIIALTLVGVLVFGVQYGLAAGAVAGLALFLWRSSRPPVVVEGFVGDSDRLRSENREAVHAEEAPVLVLRFDGSIYFGNVSHYEERVLKEVARCPEAKAVVFDMKAVNRLDASGYRMLERVVDNLSESGVKVAFAEVHKPVQELMEDRGLVRRCDTAIYLSPAEAVEDMETP